MRLTRAATLMLLAGQAVADAAPGQAQAAGAAWVITGVTLIDGTGSDPIVNAVIVGRDDRITCAGPATQCPTPEGAGTIDASGKWAIPGLIDTHVHLDWTRGPAGAEGQALRLAFGNTTTREAATPRHLDDNLAARVRASRPESPEPRLIVSGLIGEEDSRGGGATEVGASVRALIANGVDAIKVKKEFTADEMRTIVREAHAGGRPVFGHTWDSSGSHFTKAMDAGIDGLSHMTTFSMFGERRNAGRPPAPPVDSIDIWVWNMGQWSYQDLARLDAAIKRTAAAGVWIEPMLVAEKDFTLPYPLPAEFAYLGSPPSLTDMVRPWVPTGDPGWPRLGTRRAAIDRAYAHMCEFVRRFHAHGGVAVTGTDGVQPGLALVDEVRLLTGCGFTPKAAIEAATRQAAAAVNDTNIGTIEAAKLADIVLLDADPLRDPANLTRVWRVVKGGHVHHPAALLSPMASDYRDERRRAWTWRAAGMSPVVLFAAALVILRRRWLARRRPAR